MTRYRKGANKERALRSLLTREGYYVVRSAKSGGAFDLVAIKSGQVVGWQVKVGRMPTRAEREQLVTIGQRCKVKVMVAVWARRRWSFVCLYDPDANADANSPNRTK